MDAPRWRRKTSLQEPSRASAADDWLDKKIASLQELVADDGCDGPRISERPNSRSSRWRKHKRSTASGTSLRRRVRDAGGAVGAAASSVSAALLLPFRLVAAVVSVLRSGAALVLLKRSEIAFYAIAIGLSVALGAGIALLV
jgi:hypothetical protein